MSTEQRDTAGKTYMSGADMWQLNDMLTVAISSEDAEWAGEVRREMASRPETERRAWEKHGTPG
jgi:hypothetical protein